MKYLLILLLLCAIGAKAQNGLTFDKRLLDCENKWIAISLDSESRYAYGFVYLDYSAGLTFDLYGSFTVDSGAYKPKIINNQRSRITPTEVKVAIIPAERLKELVVEEFPTKYKNYAGNNNTNYRYIKFIQIFNSWKEYNMASKYVLALSETERGFPSYIEEDPTDKNKKIRKTFEITTANFSHYAKKEEAYKRDIFTLTQANKMEEAEQAYLHALIYCSNEAAKADMAYNITYQYYKNANREKFDFWCKEINRWIIPQDIYTDKIKMMAGKL
jgi:hypothetical protein